jgi:hypothetical protein
MTSELDCAHPDRASGPLDQHGATDHVARHMYGAVGRDTWYPKAGALVWRHAFGEWGHMIQRHDGKLRGGAERAIRLCTVAPYYPADPVRRYAFADLIHAPRAVAMRNDAWIRHAQAEGVLTLLDIAWVYGGGCDPNADFTYCRLRIGHLANDQYLLRRSLFLVPSCPHLKSLVFFERFFKCLNSGPFRVERAGS